MSHLQTQEGESDAAFSLHLRLQVMEIETEIDPCRGNRSCEWPCPDDPKRARPPRRPNATACDACKEKKLKCVGNIRDVCEKCRDVGITCVRSQENGGSTHSRDARRASAAFPPPSSLPSTCHPPPTSHVDESNTEDLSPLHHETTESSSRATPGPSAGLPTGKDLEDLVQLYFSSVHQFGFFAFIHELDFNRLVTRGKAPRELTLMMIASALRFSAKATPENLARADAWADAAIANTLPRIYQGFGAIQLMTLLLAQHYELNRGNFSSAWIMGANCTRMMQMMSLQTFDRTYPANLTSNLRLSPLLSCEVLRRVAWSIFFMDTIVDGGRYGFHIVDERAFRLQLPCDEARFLGNEAVITESLFPNSAHVTTPSTENLEHAPLGISAYLLRTAAARRRALHFAFRASHKEQTVEELSTELAALETDMEEVITSLPRQFHFNRDSMFLHRDRLTTFILLHVLRHNLFIVVGRAALQIYGRDFAKADLIPQVRRNRISHALPIAHLISEGLKSAIVFDPQIGVQAYVALESSIPSPSLTSLDEFSLTRLELIVLLFEPRRLAEMDRLIDPKAPDLMQAIPHLLAVIRDLADRSEFVKQLHIEAVHRLLRCDCADILNGADLSAFQSEYRLVGQDAAEYDFRDFRWAKLERIRRGVRSSANMARDEALLEYNIGGETATPSAISSPKLDAIHVTNARKQSSATAPPMHSVPSNTIDLPEAENMAEAGMSQAEEPWPGLSELENPDQVFPLEWSWLLDESGYSVFQTGDPTLFWNQLQ